jgi:uncharacterized protein YjbI with pentapeptide repeats
MTEHEVVVRKGVKAWNEFVRSAGATFRPDFRTADLRACDLTGGAFVGANFSDANLSNAILVEANFQFATFHRTNLCGIRGIRSDFRNAGLFDCDIRKASLQGACFSSAVLLNCDLSNSVLADSYLMDSRISGLKMRDAVLDGADLSGCSLSNSDLTRASLVGVDLTNAHLGRLRLNQARLMNSRVHGTSAWDLPLNECIQSELVITPYLMPEIRVDNLETAQFIYVLLNNKNVGHLIDTITSKVVLILGRFTPERKAILDAIRDDLRKRNYTPVLFDFEALSENL